MVEIFGGIIEAHGASYRFVLKEEGVQPNV